jgi:hypothetical protein
MPVMQGSIVPASTAEPAEHYAFAEHRIRKRFEQGEEVDVLPWQKLIRTLDMNGTLGSLPFMPEMLPYCGKRLKITKRLERTCEEIERGMRRISNVVFLDDLRCDGSAHGGCQKGCSILWKDAWLQEPVRVREDKTEATAVNSSPIYPFPYAFSDERYSCQSTELLKATSPISVFDFGSYLRDLRAKTYSSGELLGIVSRAAAHRVRCKLSGKSHRVLEGECTKTPRENLNLMPREWVRVKTADQIARTLDKQGKNRGLDFTVEMLPFCGREFRVLRRLEKMINEPTRQLIHVEGTVILDNVTCDGCHILRGGCPKNNYHYWREIWLERTSAPGQG